MQHQVYLTIPDSRLICSRHPFISFCARLFRKARQKQLFAKLREPFSFLLAALAVSAILVGTSYLFLAQLAESGW